MAPLARSYWKLLLIVCCVVGVELGVFQALWKSDSATFLSEELEEWIQGQTKEKTKVIQDKLQGTKIDKKFVSLTAQVVVQRTKDPDNPVRDTKFNNPASEITDRGLLKTDARIIATSNDEDLDRKSDLNKTPEYQVAEHYNQDSDGKEKQAEEELSEGNVEEIVVETDEENAEDREDEDPSEENISEEEDGSDEVTVSQEQDKVTKESEVTSELENEDGEKKDEVPLEGKINNEKKETEEGTESSNIEDKSKARKIKDERSDLEKPVTEKQDTKEKEDLSEGNTTEEDKEKKVENGEEDPSVGNSREEDKEKNENELSEKPVTQRQDVDSEKEDPTENSKEENETTAESDEVSKEKENPIDTTEEVKENKTLVNNSSQEDDGDEKESEDENYRTVKPVTKKQEEDVSDKESEHPSEENNSTVVTVNPERNDTLLSNTTNSLKILTLSTNFTTIFYNTSNDEEITSEPTPKSNDENTNSNDEDTKSNEPDDASNEPTTQAGQSSEQNYTSEHGDFSNATFSNYSNSFNSTPVNISLFQEAPVCKLPKLNIFDPAIRHLVYDEGRDPGCWKRYTKAFYKVENNRLMLVDENFSQLFDPESIQVRYIIRGADHYASFQKDFNPFNNGTAKVSEPLTSDFLKVTYNLNDGRRREFLYAHASPRINEERQQRELRRGLRANGARKGLPLNVLIVGFDSTSAANFRRKLTKSMAFLKHKLNAYVLDGMSIVGDATTPNLAAMLTGKREEALPEARKGFPRAGYVDAWPWIFKDFQKMGYMTLFAEDDPSVSAFNLRLKGFYRTPTHHYMRAFWHMVEEDSVSRDEHNLCYRQQSMTNYTLQYLSSFMSAYSPDTPKFGMGFMSYLAHAHPNHLSLVDNDLNHFLESYVRNGHYNNTMLIVMSDHGSRNDDVRDTLQGKLEERLPWFSVVLPPWFKEQYPDLADSLQYNQHLVASPFDVFATFKHILNYPVAPRVHRGQSLLTRLSPRRTCGDAGIDPHWCPCLTFTPVRTDLHEIKQGAQAAVDYFNELNSQAKNQCAFLTLRNITGASLLSAVSELQKFESTNQDSDRRVIFGAITRDGYKRYDITFITSPGGGKFEVTVGINRSREVTVSPNISRINRYGNQPNCIAKTYPYIRKYCYCKSNEDYKSR